ncbi:starch synthase 3, chloroplastic/amyloplastic isoform X2 [Ananas comosus]|uniref:starch synthase n=1 Tax=Ananas comosus TaxID=4615 RepID=A0A6P5GTK6_ANACO|nr:starch synthase 3, chloroplastic/amyloplastic isoform X2 [Ananas comosus]
MEMAVQPVKPLYCKRTLSEHTGLRIRPFIGHFDPSMLRCQGFVRDTIMPSMAASSGYSRRRPRRSLIPKTKGSTPKGFAPRPQVETSTQKKDQSEARNKGEENPDGSLMLSSSEFTNKQSINDSRTAVLDSASSVSSNSTARRIDLLDEAEEESYSKEGLDQKVNSEAAIGIDENDEFGDKVCANMQTLSVVDGFEGSVSSEIDERSNRISIKGEASSVEDDEDVEIGAVAEIDVDITEKEETLDLEERKRMLEDLAQENFEKGTKVFTFPSTVKPDETIEIFLNRSLSGLKDEREVLIKGAFNGWRWKFFTERLQKTELKGDWWSCQLYVYKQAYRIDFVFFNGANVYENNDLKDFFLPVEGTMDEKAFEDFLLEEKRKELERVAAEEAERERRAEEQRKEEEERAAREADRAQAKVEVKKKQEAFQRMKNLARDSLENVWHIEPSLFKGGDRIRLYYNRSSRPLQHSTEIWIHGGHNIWSEGLSIVSRLSPSEKRDGDWWYADVVVPDQARVIDWVFADGPPQQAKVYDNNNREDFHATVPKCMSEELFWVEEEHRIFRKLQEERRLKEQAAREKAEKMARMKAETKERTMKRFLLSQKHIVYTDPLEVRAGSTVRVLYNPSNTVLNGKPEVWIRCSFNRWTYQNGPLPPQKMVKEENGSHLEATVKVPMDAYMMDFVFSEREDGGIYDNRNGMDYHIPVSGGIVKEPPMHIVHVSVEMAPIAKVGGLGDVVTSLSRAVQDLGHTVDIILPKYDILNLSNVKDFHFRRSFAWGGMEIKVWFGKVEGLSVYFLEPLNGMFSVGCVYGRHNDAERFGFFCHAALEFLLQSGSRPDILHCHDWSSAPVAWLFKENYLQYGLSNARVVFTIHNLEFGIHQIGRAMQAADMATTVSHTYSREVSGNPAISPHLYKFHGILNGIDPDIWDPCNDQYIPVPYTPENVVEGKRAAKEALQQKLGLKRSDEPLVGIITRLTVQKGIHLIKHAIGRTLERNGQVVLLGSAPDPRIQNDFVNLKNELQSSHNNSARLCLTYDEPLSHLIYAGADMILVPSIFEPCGLTQLIAMRYGSIPVVRRTGGLYDTVFDVDNDKERARAVGLEPNGFSFDGADTSGVDYALNRAITAWYDAREWFNSLYRRVMEQDWSWNRPALDYLELYHSARK